GPGAEAPPAEARPFEPPGLEGVEGREEEERAEADEDDVGLAGEAEDLVRQRPGIEDVEGDRHPEGMPETGPEPEQRRRYWARDSLHECGQSEHGVNIWDGREFTTIPRYRRERRPGESC